jgi:site-specific DNA recombinase
MGEKAAWIYVRVSSDEQTKGYSLESQEMRCRDYAAQQGYTVMGVIKDVESGEQLDRPGMMQVIDTANTNPFDVLVVYDLDRFSRGGPAHCAILETQFERKGVTVEFVLGNFNGNSAEAMLTKYLKQTISWYENQQRRERSVRGRLTAAKHGKVLTGADHPMVTRMRTASYRLSRKKRTSCAAFSASCLRAYRRARLPNACQMTVC